MYVIVEFVKSNSAAVKPTNWFYDKKKNATESYWPKTSENISKRNKAVEEMWIPHQN